MPYTCTFHREMIGIRSVYEPLDDSLELKRRVRDIERYIVESLELDAYLSMW